MSMIEWAKKEIEIAKINEMKDVEDGGRNMFAGYADACYDSALKAFESLCGYGRSGCSIGITKNILNRLIDGKPLTPIHDTPDIWDDITDTSALNGEIANYQCKRMSSLFKKIYQDGSVKYKDVSRYFCQDSENDQSTYNFGLVYNLIDEIYPITMPYFPSSKKIKAICSDCLTDRKNGDFDTMAILSLHRPDESVVEVNRYFKESATGSGWDEIQYEEWRERVDMHHKRVVAEKEN